MTKRKYTYYVCCPKCHEQGSEGKKFQSSINDKDLPKYKHWSSNFFAGLLCGIPFCCNLYYTNLCRKGYVRIALMHKALRGYRSSYKGKETKESAYERLSSYEKAWVDEQRRMK